MSITASQVKELREATGAGIMECKRALEEAGGDITKATNILSQAGLAKAEKKSGRSARQGVVEPYVHGGGRIGSIVEVNCETDFVARTPDFQKLAHEVAMQVAAMNPQFISEDDISVEEMAALVDEYGSKNKALEAVSLLDQPFIRDPKLSIRELVKAEIGKMGENIVVRRFSRFEVGAGMDDATDEED